MISAFVKCDLSDPFIKKWIETLERKEVRTFMESDGIRFLAEEFVNCPDGTILGCHYKKRIRFIDFEIPYGITCKYHVMFN